MSFSYNKKAETPAGPKWVADRRLCLTEDRSRVVEENTPEARWLWAVPGQEVDLAEAERLGAIQSEPPRRKPGRPPAAKRATPTEDK